MSDPAENDPAHHSAHCDSNKVQTDKDAGAAQTECCSDSSDLAEHRVAAAGSGQDDIRPGKGQQHECKHDGPNRSNAALYESQEQPGWNERRKGPQLDQLTVSE